MIELDITVEQAMTLIMSAGMAQPNGDAQKKLAALAENRPAGHARARAPIRVLPPLMGRSARLSLGVAASHRGLMMNFAQAISSAFRNYVTFAGRASRSEYWYWVLFTIIGGIVTAILDHAAFSENDFPTPINSIFNVLCLLPSLAVGCASSARHRQNPAGGC